MNSSRPCDPICIPNSPLDKFTQAGKTLIVSRANPTFCVFCNHERHAGISCSSHDPVASTDAGGLSNNSTPRVSSSKCNDCVVMNVLRESSILDGILHTTRRLQSSVLRISSRTLFHHLLNPRWMKIMLNQQLRWMKTTPNHQLLNPRWMEKPPKSFLVHLHSKDHEHPCSHHLQQKYSTYSSS